MRRFIIIYVGLFFFSAAGIFSVQASAKPSIKKMKEFYLVRSADWELEAWTPYGTAVRLSKQIEKVKNGLVEYFHFELRSSQKLRILVLKNEAAFLAHSKEDLGEVFYMQGYYSAAQNEVAVWNKKPASDLLKVLSHELTHAFIYQLYTRPPVWVNEGICDYIASGSIRRGRFERGALRFNYLDRLLKAEEGKTLIPLHELVSEKGYREGNQKDLQYTQSWYLVYFLMHGENEKYQQPFMKYLKNLEKEQNLSIESYISLKEIEKVWLKKLRHLHDKSKKSRGEL